MEASQPEFWGKEGPTSKGRKYKAQAHIINWACGNCMGSGTTSRLPESDSLSVERPIASDCLQCTLRTPVAGSGNQTYCGHNVHQPHCAGQGHGDDIYGYHHHLQGASGPWGPQPGDSGTYHRTHH